MLLVGIAVASVWALLLGAAWLARGPLALGRQASLALVATCYLTLAVLAVVAIRPGGRGLLGAAGMLVPLAVAAALVLRGRGGR